MKKDSPKKKEEYTFRYIINFIFAAILISFLFYYFISGKTLEISLVSAVGMAFGLILSMIFFRILKKSK